MSIVPVSPGTDEARSLVHELDVELAARHPGLPINGIDTTDFDDAGGYFVVVKDGPVLLGCGAFRPVSDSCVEIKRMFVRAAARRRGVARSILHHLEAEIRRRGFRSVVLETGNRQSEAIAFYETEGFFPIPPFLGYELISVGRSYVK